MKTVLEKTKPTPGPWVFSGNDSAPILHIYAPDNNHLFHQDRSLEEQEANARLMAAAPELLAACKAARATHYLTESEPGLPSLTEVEQMLRAAIAKAEPAQ